MTASVPEPAPAVAPIASTSSLGLPPPKNKKRPLKIGFDHPLLSAPTLGAPSSDDVEERTTKRQRVKHAGDAEDVQDRKGKGKSTLLDMLPPPKRAAPVAQSTAVKAPQAEETEEEDVPLVPRKLAKQTGKTSAEPASLDLFGLGKLNFALACDLTIAYTSHSIDARSCAVHLDWKILVILPNHLLSSRDPRIHPAATITSRPVPGLLPTPHHPSMARLPGRNLQPIHGIHRRALGSRPGCRRTRMGRSG